jgi:hypothetical protein
MAHRGVGLQVELHRPLVAMEVAGVAPGRPQDPDGGSTRTTSAPQSASCRTHWGPARAMVRSTTLMSLSGAGLCGH